MTDGCVCWVIGPSYEMNFGGFLMKHDRAGGLGFQNSIHFIGDKNALLPIG